jgi:DNA-binding MarR family transcriptional regulator
MKSIADYLHIKPSSATTLIDNLVKKGYMKRIQKGSDRRVVYIELTSKGLKVLQKKYKSIHKTLKKIFKKINNKDKNNLIKIFKKIHAENI